MRILMLMITLLLTTPASAQDRASVLLGALHPGGTGFESVTPGLILTWEDRGGLDLSLAAYRNSYGRGSIAAMAGLPLARWHNGALSLTAGIAWYPGDGRRFAVHAGDVVPLVGLQVRYRHLFALILPGDGRTHAATIAAGITFPIR